MYRRWSSVVLLLLENGNGNSRLENKVCVRINIYNASWNGYFQQRQVLRNFVQICRDNAEILEQRSLNDIEYAE